MTQSTLETKSDNSSANKAPATTDAISLILAQAGRTADEIASLATLDDADRAAEQQFSGEAPTLVTLFGSARAIELDAGHFEWSGPLPGPGPVAVMGSGHQQTYALVEF